jgi:hypothetical protein
MSQMPRNRALYLATRSPYFAERCTNSIFPLISIVDRLGIPQDRQGAFHRLLFSPPSAYSGIDTFHWNRRGSASPWNSFRPHATLGEKAMESRSSSYVNLKKKDCREQLTTSSSKAVTTGFLLQMGRYPTVEDG